MNVDKHGRCDVTTKSIFVAAFIMCFYPEISLWRVTTGPTGCDDYHFWAADPQQFANAVAQYESDQPVMGIKSFCQQLHAIEKTTIEAANRGGILTLYLGNSVR